VVNTKKQYKVVNSKKQYIVVNLKKKYNPMIDRTIIKTKSKMIFMMIVILRQ